MCSCCVLPLKGSTVSTETLYKDLRGTLLRWKVTAREEKEEEEVTATPNGLQCTHTRQHTNRGRQCNSVATRADIQTHDTTQPEEGDNTTTARQTSAPQKHTSENTTSPNTHTHTHTQIKINTFSFHQMCGNNTTSPKHTNTNKAGITQITFCHTRIRTFNTFSFHHMCVSVWMWVCVELYWPEG